MKQKVCTGMSGGVDSSLTALLLKEQGYEVCGLTMNVFGKGYDTPGASAVRDAKKVADYLGIEHHAVDVSKEFSVNIMQNFISEYKSGRTPNPCIMCNRIMKFGLLAGMGRELGCQFFATGHYARIENSVLLRGADRHKDQSYFLYVLYGARIDSILFPLGGMHKKDVRDMALKAGLPTHSRTESQDVCFVPDDDHIRFLENVIELKSGPIVDVSGKVIGTHSGIHRYTIGQRKGLGPLGRPMFVKEIRPDTNTVVAADDSDLGCSAITVNDIVTGPGQIIPGDIFDVQVRYRSQPSLARIREFDGKKMVLDFEKPVRAIAPGQAAVLYNGDRVMAGGTIRASVM
jgi:tRNA-specific 2-thiouridylase